MSEHKERTEALRIAMELQAEAERKAEAERQEQAMRKTAAEVGIAPDLYDRAREVQAAQKAEAAAALQAKQARQAVWVRRGLLVSAALVALVGLPALLLRPPPPPEPYADAFDAAAGRWALQANPESQAEVRWASEAGRGDYAVIDVASFGADSKGKYFVNLDTTSIPDSLAGYETVSFAVSGQGLGVVRIYLEQDVYRWRSPPISVTDTWTVQTIPLTDFELQQKNGSEWSVQRWEAPDTVRTVSFKVGHYMNPADASGEVKLDDLTFR